MSINGEVTAIHISRKSTKAGPKEEILDYEQEEVHEEKLSSRPPSGRHRPRNERLAREEEKERNVDQVMRADSDQIDLDRLLSSMLDISQHKNRKPVSQRPFSAYPVSRADEPFDSFGSEDSFGQSRTRVRPFSAHTDKERKANYSFSNSKVEQIDRENQRLLKALMSHQKKVKEPVFVKKAEPLKVHASATLNRFRHQQQIERENLAFLRRLEKVKPTKGLARDHLLREHFKQEQFAKNVSRSKRRPASAVITQPSRKSRSTSDLRSADNESIASSAASSQRRQGASSTKRYMNDRSKPVWEAGW